MCFSRDIENLAPGSNSQSNARSHTMLCNCYDFDNCPKRPPIIEPACELSLAQCFPISDQKQGIWASCLSI